jgi:TPP-dependent trihydroxycyclohexane-1,2-dione (THcHDO) dehydratase
MEWEMRVTDTDQPAIDRRRFFHLAVGGVSLAACAAGGVAIGLNRRGVLGVAAGGAGIAAIAATGTALSEEANEAASPLPSNSVAVAPTVNASSIKASAITKAWPLDVPAAEVTAARPVENLHVRTASLLTPAASWPGPDRLRAAAEVLNSGRRIAILCGRGALSARAELRRLADLLEAPVVTALTGHEATTVWGSRVTINEIGALGTAPSNWALKNCDTLLIIGSDSPWLQYYPTPGQARAVQVDIEPDRLGARYPVEIGLAGNVQATIRGLLPLLSLRAERGFIQEASRRAELWDRWLADADIQPRASVKPVVEPIDDEAALRMIERSVSRGLLARAGHISV